MSDIDDIATAWVVRSASGTMDAAEKAELDAWLQADLRHQGAYFRAEGAWFMLQRANVQNAGVDQPESRRTRRAWLIGAGTLALAGVGAAVAFFGLNGPTTIETKVGEQRKIQLADKSFVSLNTDSRVDVQLSRQRRDIQLAKGEAWFEVAKDPGRPFVVSVGTVEARAVGTAFSVRRFTSGAQVLVTEGVVEVTRQAHKIALRVGDGAFVPFDGAPVVVSHDPDRVLDALAWRDGDIVLDEESLQQAALEFNRYNARKIVIADPSLQAEKLVGRFRLNQPDVFVKSVQDALNVEVRTEDDLIIISRTMR